MTNAAKRIYSGNEFLGYEYRGHDVLINTSIPSNHFGRYNVMGMDFECLKKAKVWINKLLD